MTTDSRSEDKPVTGQQSEESGVDDRRVQARRRFLRMGAGGTAALVVTVTHRRAFAGAKRNVVASNCGSLQGVPDLKNADKKNALEASAMGTPKGLICRPKDEPPPVCPTTGGEESRYYKFANESGKQLYTRANDFKKGCGSIEQTVQVSHNYRLYEKGYCPLKYDANGLGLYYDTNATYYEKEGGGSNARFVEKLCKSPRP